MDNYQQFRDLISKITEEEPLKISCIVGAGLSAGSGLETFRGKDGMWKEKDPYDLASREGFIKNPELVWSWYRERIAKVMDTEPNAGHKALVELEELGLLDLIITQNVDGLHLQAGQSQEKLVEIHGTLSRVHCLENCGVSKELDGIPEQIPLRCDCGSYLRPSVVWFGEGIPVDVEQVLQQMMTESNLLLVIGTSGTVMPVARIPYLLSDFMDVININPDNGFERIAAVNFADKAETVLPRLVTIIEELI